MVVDYSVTPGQPQWSPSAPTGALGEPARPTQCCLKPLRTAAAIGAQVVAEKLHTQRPRNTPAPQATKVRLCQEWVMAPGHSGLASRMKGTRGAGWRPRAGAGWAWGPSSHPALPEPLSSSPSSAVGFHCRLERVKGSHWPDERGSRGRKGTQKLPFSET